MHTRICIRPSHPQEYPAGQVLSEGLQNAEDAGASKFAFMLDLRRHAVPVLDPSLQGFAGPAFVLADDGRGFAGREWESLQNLHASKKRDSPSDIGSFGMGTRSYFHYSDIVLVASQNMFVGLDPLEIAGEEGGWMLDVTKEADEAGQKGVAMLELPHFDVRTGGSIFRLPLRRDEHPVPAAGRFGKEISEARAREMLEDFAKQLAGGEMLLFLTHVVCIELWLWDADAEAPTLRERVQKVLGIQSEKICSCLEQISNLNIHAVASSLLLSTPPCPSPPRQPLAHNLPVPRVHWCEFCSIQNTSPSKF